MRSKRAFFSSALRHRVLDSLKLIVEPTRKNSVAASCLAERETLPRDVDVRPANVVLV